MPSELVYTGFPPKKNNVRLKTTIKLFIRKAGVCLQPENKVQAELVDIQASLIFLVHFPL